MPAAPFLETRAMRLVADARTHPHTAKYALAWVDRASARAVANHDFQLAEALANHGGAIRAIISRLRREDYAMCYCGCPREDSRGECLGGKNLPCEEPSEEYVLALDPDYLRDCAIEREAEETEEIGHA